MAAPIIYTGENYARYTPSPGRAISALGQLSQQRMYEREREKQRARQDRDRMLGLLDLEPVYATSVKLQERQAKVMQDWQQEAAQVYNSIGSRTPTTEELAKLQQMKAQAAARIGQLGSWDAELQRASRLVQNPNSPYSERKFAEAYQDWADSGFEAYPTEGLLFKKERNAGALFDAYLSSKREEPKASSVAVTLPSGDIRYDYNVDWREAETQKPAGDWVAEFGSNPDIQYYIQDNFEDDTYITPTEREQRVQQAGGDRDVAANMWFQEKNINKVYPKRTYSRTTSYRPSTTEAPAMNAIVSDGAYMNKDGAGFSVQESVNAPGIGTVRGIVFNHGKYPNRLEVQMDKSVFGDSLNKGTAFLEGNNVTVRPYVLTDDGRVVWEVMGKRLEEVTDAMEVLNLRKKGHLIEKGGKKYKEVPAEWGEIAVSSWDDAKGKIASDAYNYRGIADVYENRFANTPKWEGEKPTPKKSGGLKGAVNKVLGMFSGSGTAPPPEEPEEEEDPFAEFKR